MIVNTDTETMDFVKCFDKEEDIDDLHAAILRHVANMDTDVDVNQTANVSAKPIIPTPLKIEQASTSAATTNQTQQVHIDSDWTVVHDVQLRNEAKFIASRYNNNNKITF